MKFLFLNQTFYPDVVATGQYLSDVALAVVERGHSVTVITSRLAYDEPLKIYPRRQTWQGIEIIRVWSTGFGKEARWRRAIDFASFIASCAVRAAFLRRHDVVIALTSPPLISLVGALVALIRQARFIYWVMDLNPDEAIAAGWLREHSIAGNILEAFSRFSLRRATKVMVLDRFMRERIIAKGIAPDKVLVSRLWSQGVRFDRAGRDQFRQRHGLEGKFVVMYSGNHSPCHPLDTVLEAAKQLASDPEIVFCFVGGGSEFRRIRAQCAGIEGNSGNSLRNVLCLPYQPRSELAASLSAADLHLLVMGDPFVGLVHPCKIYNLLSIGMPILYIGPSPSHVTEIVKSVASRVSGGNEPGWAKHGDVTGIVSEIIRLRKIRGKVECTESVDLSGDFSAGVLVPQLVSAMGADSNSSSTVRTLPHEEWSFK